MSKSRPSTYKFFSLVAVVGLALFGTMACAQDNDAKANSRKANDLLVPSRLAWSCSGSGAVYSGP